MHVSAAWLGQDMGCWLWNKPENMQCVMGYTEAAGKGLNL